MKSHGDVDEIIRIANVVEKITNECGFKRENRFVPHVTIAQDVNLKISFDELKILLKDYEIPNIILDKIDIMKSEEIDGKRIYTPLKNIYLK